MPCRDTLGIAKLDQSARSLRDAKDMVNELTSKKGLVVDAAVDRCSSDAEQFGELGDRVRAGFAYLEEMSLLRGAELGRTQTADQADPLSGQRVRERLDHRTGELSIAVALADVATVGGVERTDGTIKHFSQSNPAGDGQGDVAALLRRVAQTIDDLGDVSIEDVTFTSSVTEGEDDLAMTVYYYPEPRRR